MGNQMGTAVDFIPRSLMMLILGAVTIILATCLWLFVSRTTPAQSSKEPNSSQPTPPPQEKLPTAIARKAEKQTKGKGRGKTLPHPSLLGVTKGQTNPCTSFCWGANSRLLFCCSEDRTARSFKVDALISSKETREQRFNIEGDEPYCCCAGTVAPKYVVVALRRSKMLRIIELGLNSASNAIKREFALGYNSEESASDFLFFPSEHFILSADRDTTEVVVHDLQGTRVESLKTNQIKINDCACTAGGRFFLSAGFTKEIRVFEACMKKDGSLAKLQRVNACQGHTAAVLGVSVSSGLNAASLSKDGSFKIWNLDVNTRLDEDPKCLLTVKIESDEVGQLSGICLSSDASKVCIYGGNTCLFYQGITSSGSDKPGSPLGKIHGLHDTCILHAEFSACGKMLATRGEGAGSVKIWKADGFPAAQIA